MGIRDPHPDIEMAVRVVLLAKQVLDSTLDNIRKQCDHSIVVERPLEKRNTMNIYSQPRRLCCNCGYEEQGYFCGAGWSDGVEGRWVLNNCGDRGVLQHNEDRIIEPVSEQTFNKIRSNFWG